jgi:hypothetical protein
MVAGFEAIKISFSGDLNLAVSPESTYFLRGKQTVVDSEILWITQYREYMCQMGIMQQPC